MKHDMAFWSTWSRGFFPQAGSVTAETEPDAYLKDIPTETLRRAAKRYIRELTRRIVAREGRPSS